MLASCRGEAQIEKVKVKSLEDIFRSLQEADARYLVVGGLAVIAHGYVRITKDVDLVLDLSTDSLKRSLKVLQDLGYRPINPVPIMDFADPELRRDWTENRHMVVFNLVSDRFPGLAIDVFTKEPFEFEAEYARAESKEIAPNIWARVVSVATLITLKKVADRDQDRIDIAKLRKLYPEYES
jgi:hypothetical protein